MYICIPLKHTQYNHKCGAIIAVCSALWEQTFIFIYGNKGKAAVSEDSGASVRHVQYC